MIRDGSSFDVPMLPFAVIDERVESRPSEVVIDGAVSHMNVEIAKLPGWRPLRVDVHLPAHSAGPHPVVVYAHGGSFIGGRKEMGPWASLPRRGMAVVSVEYRLAGEVSYPDNVEDILTAIRWTRSPDAATFGLDSSRVAAWGSSAGAYLVARAAVSDGVSGGLPVPELQRCNPLLDAVVLHYPPIEHETAVADVRARGQEPSPQLTRLLSFLYGMSWNDAGLADALADGSVTRAVDSAHHLPPFHVSHGDADETVSNAQSRVLRDGVRARGGLCELIEVAGEGHASAAFEKEFVVGPAIDFLFEQWS